MQLQSYSQGFSDHYSVTDLLLAFMQDVLDTHIYKTYSWVSSTGDHYAKEIMDLQYQNLEIYWGGEKMCESTDE